MLMMMISSASFDDALMAGANIRKKVSSSSPPQDFLTSGVFNASILSDMRQIFSSAALHHHYTTESLSGMDMCDIFSRQQNAANCCCYRAYIFLAIFSGGMMMRTAALTQE